MSEPTHDLMNTLSSIDNIKAYLSGVVQAAADNRDGSFVLLTYVGGEFAKAVGTTFEKHLTALADQQLISVPKAKRKLVIFVQTYCDDTLALDKTAAGAYLVASRATRDAAPDTSSPAIPAPSPLRFHRAVWAAFIRPLDGKRRYLNLDQIGFTDASAVPSGGSWKEIDERFVLGVSPHASVDGNELQTRIEEWSKLADVPISKLILSAKPTRTSAGQLEQLLDIIDALPTQVAAQWSIPAAVLKQLRAAR